MRRDAEARKLDHEPRPAGSAPPPRTRPARSPRAAASAPSVGIDVGGQISDQPRHHRVRRHRPKHPRLGARHRDITRRVPFQRDRNRQIQHDLGTWSGARPPLSPPERSGKESLARGNTILAATAIPADRPGRHPLACQRHCTPEGNDVRPTATKGRKTPSSNGWRSARGWAARRSRAAPLKADVDEVSVTDREP